MNTNTAISARVKNYWRRRDKLGILGCVSIAVQLLSLYQCTLLPMCTVATAVKEMCQYYSTVTVCNSNPHCHYISAHCYQYVL